MFKFFSGKSEPKTEVATSSSKYPAIVEEIHNEFFTAGDNILEEATDLLKKLETEDIAKGKRLAACGFGSAKQATKALFVEKSVNNAKEMAELAVYYQKKYINNKFITEEQVKAICEKYGLVCGGVELYTGFVPENKLWAIESFKLRKEDVGVSLSNGMFLKNAEVLRKGNYFHIFKIGEVDKFNYCMQSDDGINFYSRDSKNIFGLQEQGDVRASVMGLQICAPLKDMNVKNNQRINGYKIENIPDPVVLHPVKGGYLIICAWGDEASDEIVVNEKMN